MGWTRIDPLAPRLNARIDAIALGAINDTTAAAAIYAKQNHPSWKNVTGAAEGSIAMRPAEKVGPTRYRGLFGSFDIAYFIWLEIGHHVLSTRGFERTGHPETSFGKFVHGDHTLRRAADAEFSKLGARVKARMRR